MDTVNKWPLLLAFFCLVSTQMVAGVSYVPESDPDFGSDPDSLKLSYSYIGYSLQEELLMQKGWSYNSADLVHISAMNPGNLTSLERFPVVRIQGLKMLSSYRKFSTFHMLEHAGYRLNNTDYPSNSASITLDQTIDLSLFKYQDRLWFGGQFINEVNDPSIHLFDEFASSNVEFIRQNVHLGFERSFRLRSANLRMLSAFDYSIYSRTNTLINDKVDTQSNVMRITYAQDPYDDSWFPYTEKYTVLNVIHWELGSAKVHLNTHNVLSPRRVYWQPSLGAETPVSMNFGQYSFSYETEINQNNLIKWYAGYASTEENPIQQFTHLAYEGKQKNVESTIEWTRRSIIDYEFATTIEAVRIQNNETSMPGFHMNPGISLALSKGKELGMSAKLTKDYWDFRVSNSNWKLQYRKQDYFEGYSKKIQEMLGLEFAELGYNWTYKTKGASLDLRPFYKYYFKYSDIYYRVDSIVQGYPYPTSEVIETQDHVDLFGLKGLFRSKLLELVSWNVQWIMTSKVNEFKGEHHRLILNQQLQFTPPRGFDITLSYRFLDSRLEREYELLSGSHLQPHELVDLDAHHQLNFVWNASFLNDRLTGFIVVRNMLRDQEVYDSMGQYYDMSVTLGFSVDI